MTIHRIMSFKYAIKGIITALKEEENFVIQVLIGIIAVELGIVYSITSGQWITVFMVIGLILCLELINTAIEEIIDSFTKNVHPGARRAKDVAAGAVLMAAIMGVGVGLILFLPHFLKTFFWLLIFLKQS